MQPFLLYLQLTAIIICHDNLFDLLRSSSSQSLETFQSTVGAEGCDMDYSVSLIDDGSIVVIGAIPVVTSGSMLGRVEGVR